MERWWREGGGSVGGMYTAESGLCSGGGFGIGFAGFGTWESSNVSMIHIQV